MDETLQTTDRIIATFTCSTFHALGLYFAHHYSSRTREWKNKLEFTYSYAIRDSVSSYSKPGVVRVPWCSIKHDPSIRFVKAKERYDDRLWVGDSALASGHGEGVVGQFEIAWVPVVLLNHTCERQCRSSAFPKCKFSNASILYDATNTNITKYLIFLKSLLAKLHSSKLQCCIYLCAGLGCKSWLSSSDGIGVDLGETSCFVSKNLPSSSRLLSLFPLYRRTFPIRSSIRWLPYEVMILGATVVALVSIVGFFESSKVHFPGVRQFLRFSPPGLDMMCVFFLCNLCVFDVSLCVCHVNYLDSGCQKMFFFWVREKWMKDSSIHLYYTMSFSASVASSHIPKPPVPLHGVSWDTIEWKWIFQEQMMRIERAIVSNSYTQWHDIQRFRVNHQSFDWLRSACSSNDGFSWDQATPIESLAQSCPRLSESRRCNMQYQCRPQNLGIHWVSERLNWYLRVRIFGRISTHKVLQSRCFLKAKNEESWCQSHTARSYHWAATRGRPNVWTRCWGLLDLKICQNEIHDSDFGMSNQVCHLMWFHLYSYTFFVIEAPRAHLWQSWSMTVRCRVKTLQMKMLRSWLWRLGMRKKAINLDVVGVVR